MLRFRHLKMNNKKLIQTLKTFDFDANHGTSQEHVHGLCPYPARMHPHVVKMLLKQLTKKNSIVYDPYCGSGTVLVEAMLNGNKSFGTDTNPLASLITKVKTTPIKSKVLSQAYSKIERDIELIKNKSFQYELPFGIKEVHLDYWFKPNTIRRLSVIYHLLNSKWLNFDNAVYDFIKLSFARLVREVSTVRKNEFKLYRQPKEMLKIYTPRIFDTYLNILQDNIRRMNEFNEIVRSNHFVKFKPHVYNKRNDKVKLKNKVDLVFTSPPYGDNPTTITYGQFSRYPLLWLDYPKDIIYSLDKFPSFNDEEYYKKISIIEESRTYRKISRQIRNKDTHRAQVVEEYFVAIMNSFERINACLKNEGRICMIIGPRTVRNILVPNNKIIEEISATLNLSHVCSMNRNISFKTLPTRNSSASTILTEKVMSLQKR